MYMGWYDATKRRPAGEKLAEAVAHYREKFGKEPETVLVNAALAEELGDVEIPIQPVTFLSTNTFYVGVDDEPAPPVEWRR